MQGDEEEGAKSPTTAALLKVLCPYTSRPVPAICDAARQPAALRSSAVQPAHAGGVRKGPAVKAIYLPPSCPCRGFACLQDDLSDDEEEYAVRAC